MKLKFMLAIVALLIASLYFFLNYQEKKSEEEKDIKSFSEVKNSKNLLQTEILPTLEHKITVGKNGIYSAALLYAWEEIRKKISKPISINSLHKDLILINDSKSYLNTLQKHEFYSKAIIRDNEITAEARFKKSLPFDGKLSSFQNELSFNNTKVESFGQKGRDSVIEKIMVISYYKDNDEFIIRLIPQDKEHEIFLYKPSLQETATLSEIVMDMNRKIEMGNKVKKDNPGSWAYEIQNDEEIVIPKLRFNIEHNFENIVGNEFKSIDSNYLIGVMYQKTSFLLNEFGSEIESEMYITTGILEDPPPPKMIRFDKPFLVVLKRIDNPYPYFVMWVANAELMIKE